MDISVYFKSVLDQDREPIVICDLEHKIIYMNPVACEYYQKYGGVSLLGQSVLDCHNPRSVEMIHKVVDWFKEDRKNNMVHTYYSKSKNMDIYMIAMRDEAGELIGYYEKHESRNRDEEPLYRMD